MNLRTRLALSVLLTALPLAAGVVWLRERVERLSIEATLREFALSRMEMGGREMCERRPETFQGPGRPRRGPPGGRGPLRHRDRPRPPPPPGRARLWAYDSSFVSKNKNAPPFPDRLKVDGSIIDGDVIVVSVTMGWDDGPCSRILVKRPFGDEEPDQAVLWGLVTMCLLLLLAVLAAAGPIVRRIRRLQREVKSGRARVTGSDEIADLATAFNEAFDNLRRFVANTTHDMMIPLTVLQGHLDALQRGEADEEALRHALEEAHYMGSLMHNLSAAAKLEGDPRQVRRDDVDLNALIERVAARHMPLAKVRGVELGFAVPPDPVRVTGDVTLVEQAVSNIVHNAVRYNRKGGHVSILLDAGTIRVTDDGPGVADDEQLGRLTERRFRSEEARTRDPDGGGLGLAIAADVVARHGWTLSFAHSDGGGLEATIAL